MLSIQELINEVSSIKQSSMRLSAAVNAASQELNHQGAVIAGLVQGSRTGQEAVVVVGTATRALTDASASMAELGRTCDRCTQSLTE